MLSISRFKHAFEVLFVNMESRKGNCCRAIRHFCQSLHQQLVKAIDTVCELQTCSSYCRQKVEVFISLSRLITQYRVSINAFGFYLLSIVLFYVPRTMCLNGVEIMACTKLIISRRLEILAISTLNVS